MSGHSPIRIALKDRFIIVALAAGFVLVGYGIFIHWPRQVVPGDAEYVEYIEDHVAACIRARVAKNRNPSQAVLRPNRDEAESTCRLIVTEFDRNHPESRPYR